MVEVKRFWCLLLDNGAIEPFFVDIGLDGMVVELKEVIRSSKNCMRQYDARDIALYKLKEPIPMVSSTDLLQSIKNKGEIETFAVQLEDPFESLSDVLPDGVAARVAHFLVKLSLRTQASAGLLAPTAIATSSSAGSVLSNADDDLTLYCWVLNASDAPFPIDIGKSKGVGHLKRMIKKENEHKFAAIDADKLVIWKLSSPIPSAEIGVTLRDIQSPQQIPGCVELNALDELSEHFSSAPRKHLHIIVEAPTRMSNSILAQAPGGLAVHMSTDLHFALEEDSGPPSKRARLTSPENQPSPKRQCLDGKQNDEQDQLPKSDSSDSNKSQPTINSCWSPRSNTVRGLYNILREERLVQVRGTPGCGKTTLNHLLHAYIVEKQPFASVLSINSWPPPGQTNGSFEERLKLIDPRYPNPGLVTFMLFDEGQDSYSDEYLWNTFFKGVQGGHFKDYRVILFCSYGSPSARPVSYKVGTPLTLHVSARVSLWPSKHSIEPIGLLLTRAEFNEVVARHERKLNLHPDLLDHFFHLTVGHVGAVIDLLRITSYQRVAEMRKGMPFTVDAFNAENPTGSLIIQLQGGPFGRGVPQARELSQDLSITSFFRTLIRDGVFEEREAEQEAVRACHRNGWIHSYINAESTTCYTFPSPLHSAYVSWLLKPSDDMPTYRSVFDLCFAAISKFKPSQMHTPIRRVGASHAIDPLPEAQYQDEFYRTVFSATAGSVCISPEFASARGAHLVGRIDFFIPTVKWGIEIIRDGHQLSEHNSRFTRSGAYGAWLKSGDMTDYILLDFRTKSLRKCHPDIPNLFHIVFGDGYQTATVYDNQLKQVGGTIALLENHF